MHGNDLEVAYTVRMQRRQAAAPTAPTWTLVDAPTRASVLRLEATYIRALVFDVADALTKLPGALYADLRTILGKLLTVVNALGLAGTLIVAGVIIYIVANVIITAGHDMRGLLDIIGTTLNWEIKAINFLVSLFTHHHHEIDITTYVKFFENAKKICGAYTVADSLDYLPRVMLNDSVCPIMRYLWQTPVFSLLNIVMTAFYFDANPNGGNCSVSVDELLCFLFFGLWRVAFYTGLLLVAASVFLVLENTSSILLGVGLKLVKATAGFVFGLVSLVIFPVTVAARVRAHPLSL